MKVLINRRLINKVEELSKKKYSFKFNKDDAILLLNTIYYGTNIRNSIEDDGFISLCAIILVKTIGKNYNQYIKIFIDNNIIDKINYCKSCNTCNKYRINEGWIDSQEEEYEITNWSSLKRVSGRKNIMKSVIKKYSHLWKWFNSDKFRLDSKSAIVKLKSLKLPDSKFRTNLNSIYNFKNNNKWFIRHNKDKRIHNNITNMKSEIREFLSFDGEKLKNIDIANSQLYFLLYIINNIHKNSITTIIMEDFSVSLCHKEIERFQKLILNGTFYIHLGEKLIKEKGCDGVYEYRRYDKKYGGVLSHFHDDPKKLMKPITFEILFSKNTNQSFEKKWFRKEFPTIMNLIEKIKEKDHTKLALLLQNIEAEAVLDITTKNIDKFNKDIPMYTIHDSIMTIEKYVKSVKRIFEESLFNMTGFIPKLNVE